MEAHTAGSFHRDHRTESFSSGFSSASDLPCDLKLTVSLLWASFPQLHLKEQKLCLTTPSKQKKAPREVSNLHMESTRRSQISLYEILDGSEIQSKIVSNTSCWWWIKLHKADLPHNSYSDSRGWKHLCFTPSWNHGMCKDKAEILSIPWWRELHRQMSWCKT